MTRLNLETAWILRTQGSFKNLTVDRSLSATALISAGLPRVRPLYWKVEQPGRSSQSASADERSPKAARYSNVRDQPRQTVVIGGAQRIHTAISERGAAIC
jgi:hypothetical protein